MKMAAKKPPTSPAMPPPKAMSSRTAIASRSDHLAQKLPPTLGMVL